MFESQNAAHGVGGLHPNVQLISNAHVEHDLRYAFKKHCKANTATHSNARALPQFLVAHHYDQTGRVEDEDYNNSGEEDASDEVVFPRLITER